MKEKLTTRELIGAGAFGAIYVALLFVVSMILSMAPIALLLTPFVMGVIGATVYMVYVSKIQKTGAVMILAILVGLITSNATIYPFFLALIWGVIAEVILKVMGREKRSSMLVSYCVFNFTSIGPLFTLILAKEAVLETYKVYYGEAYANTIDKYTPSWVLLVFIALAVAGAVNGCVVGGRLLKKHFSRVGVAS